MVKKSYKKIFFIATLIFIIFAIFITFRNNNDKVVVNNAKNTSDTSATNNSDSSDFSIKNGYSLEIENGNNQSGVLNIDSNKDYIDVQVGNVGLDREMVFKVYYDYKNIEFKLLDDKSFKTEHIFKIKDGEKKTLSLKLSDDIIPDEYLHKLMISIYQSPNKYSKDYKEKSSDSGMSLNYDIKFKDSKVAKFNNTNTGFKNMKKFESAKNTLDLSFSGVLVNTDFKNEGPKDSIVLLPKDLVVSKNQEVDLMYYLGKMNNTEQYLIFATLGWKQVNIDNQPYKLVKGIKDKVVSDKFSIKAPSKPGKYDFVAYVIENPFSKNTSESFYPIEDSFRFTIEVK